ncbi:hypothetical protein FRC03_009406 [Tulasnella sp. 419]|nr:hypothetical protein FRC03_009406 [Tulasnella sp. 419]
MPQQPDSAKPVRISSISRSLVGAKLRVVGRMLSYNPEACTVLLVHFPHAVLVDISICLDPKAGLYFMQEEQQQLMIMGYLEELPAQMELPALPYYVDSPPEVNSRLILRAILVKEVPDLNLAEWDEGVGALEQLEGSR